MSGFQLRFANGPSMARLRTGIIPDATNLYFENRTSQHGIEGDWSSFKAGVGFQSAGFNFKTYGRLCFANPPYRADFLFMKCIYCLQDKQNTDFLKREHVIPQCLGKFLPDNIILYESVCDQCNQYFGDNLELYLGRDSFEGIQRHKYGITPKSPLRRRLRIKSKSKNPRSKNVVLISPYKGV